MSTKTTDDRPLRAPSLLDAVLPLAILIGLLALSLYLYGTDTTDGLVQVALIISAFVAAAIALAVRMYSPFPTILRGALAGGIMAVILQPDLDSIGVMDSMLNTIWLILAALSFGAVADVPGRVRSAWPGPDQSLPRYLGRGFRDRRPGAVEYLWGLSQRNAWGCYPGLSPVQRLQSVHSVDVDPARIERVSSQADRRTGRITGGGGGRGGLGRVCTPSSGGGGRPVVMLRQRRIPRRSRSVVAGRRFARGCFGCASA
ncbi:MAG: hypothetical protein ACRDJW_14605 [Thermomicrobiales bacterium]